MTEKDVKAKNFDILHFVADNAGLSTFEAIEKAYYMGVSEKESILDKIRAEVITKYPKNYAGEPELGGRTCEFSLNQILQIIDKYKAESEVGE